MRPGTAPPTSHLRVAFSFLEAPCHHLIVDLLDRLDTERRYEFEERVGAIELDSKAPRDEAEALALIDLLRTHPAAHVGVTALEVDRGGVTDTVVTTELDAVDRHFGRESLAHIVDLHEVVQTDFGGLARLTPDD